MLRRQIARDLHNGAQQRLVSLLIGVQLAREALEVDPSYAQELLKDAAEQAQLAIDELRELAAGVHPSILTTRGLLPAVEALATRAALPVTVAGSVAERPPAAVETSIYFIVAEALTNAVKHASASHVTITVGSDDARLMIEVRDDGVGGASLDTAGSGLAGLVDRVDALDGRLVLDSPPGVGTTLRVEIPLGPTG
jgi:signal transduction histidine kinase